MKQRFTLLVIAWLFFVLANLSVHGNQEADEMIPGQPGTTLSSEAERTGSSATVSSDTEATVPILAVESPVVADTGYILKGEVRYENVGDEAMLEMWNVFQTGENGNNEQRYFSRTANERGPMGVLKGTSDWRPFLLPFNLADAPENPSHLKVNAILPEGGSVSVRNLELVEWDPKEGLPIGPPTYFGLILMALAIFGGTVATASGVFLGLSHKKPGFRHLVKIGIGIMVGLGAFLAFLALVTPGAMRGFFIGFGLLLLILGAVFGSVLVRHRPVEEELRRMTAADL
ncbi:MAG: hypothetical protein HKN23_10860 [Verrucomicrobiales bacterium]|nr:hypothetical protein [Verrucomicrobiales bacterium]